MPYHSFRFRALISLLLTVVFVCCPLPSCGKGSYDEATMQDYAHRQYAEIFADAGGLEDNILIVFLVDDDNTQYHCTAVVGDHVADSIYDMFCGDESQLAQAVSSSVSEYYAHSLDRCLCKAMSIMSESFVDDRWLFSVWCEESNVGVESRLINRTDLPINQSMVDGSLLSFADEVGVPVVILVEDSKDVF